MTTGIRYVKRICPYCGVHKPMMVGQLVCDECENAGDADFDIDFQAEYKGGQDE